MYLPKKDIYNNLKGLDAVVLQVQPKVFNKLPVVTFQVTNNDIETDLNNEINSQNIEVQIDIWHETSSKASALLSQVEEIMRNDLYLMTYSSDVPNSGNLSHIVSRFNKKII